MLDGKPISVRCAKAIAEFIRRADEFAAEALDKAIFTKDSDSKAS